MIHRRELLLVGAGVVAAKATASALACASDSKMDDDKKADAKKIDTKKTAKSGPAQGKAPAAADPHAGHAGADGGSPPVAHAAFTAALAKCVNAGNACQAHCLKLLAKGDTSMAECATSVTEMLAVCEAVAALAAMDSKHLKAAAKLCHDMCTDCEAACNPHVGHHAQCKACAEACSLTVAEAKKLV